MKTIKKSNSLGALRRRFERDAFFQHAPRIIGPAVMSGGKLNADLALRFGTFQPVEHPKRKSIRIFGVVFELVWGENARRWAEMSDMERSWLVSNICCVGI